MLNKCQLGGDFPRQCPVRLSWRGKSLHSQKSLREVFFGKECVVFQSEDHTQNYLPVILPRGVAGVTQGMGLRGWRVGRKENFCASCPRQGTPAHGVAHHRGPQPCPTGDRILAQVPTSAPTHCSANKGSVERVVLRRVPAHVAIVFPLQGQSDLSVISKTNHLSGFAHLLQGGHKSSSSVWMATAHRHRLSKGLSTPHPMAPESPTQL